MLCERYPYAICHVPNLVEQKLNLVLLNMSTISVSTHKILPCTPGDAGASRA
jgi:hypothetical protein